MGSLGSSRWRAHQRATTVEECRRVAAGGPTQAWAPCPRCARRVRFLYQPRAQDASACRRCHGLTYRSRQQHDKALDTLRQMEPEQILTLLTTQPAADLPLGLALRVLRLADEWMRAWEREEELLVQRPSGGVVR